MMAYKGKYKVTNIKKYAGDPTKCIYRSLWEKRFMKFCEENNNILRWSSEEIVIPYKSPVDNKWHRYFVDFWIEAIDKTNKKYQALIEIKPKKQTAPPKKPNKLSRSYINEAKRYAVNESKWKFAEEYCENRGWKFIILTEDNIFGKGNGKCTKK